MKTLEDVVKILNGKDKNHDAKFYLENRCAPTIFNTNNRRCPIADNESYRYIYWNKDLKKPKYVIRKINRKSCFNVLKIILESIAKENCERGLAYREMEFSDFHEALDEISIWLLCENENFYIDREFFYGIVQDYIVIINIIEEEIRFYHSNPPRCKDKHFVKELNPHTMDIFSVANFLNNKAKKGQYYDLEDAAENSNNPYIFYTGIEKYPIADGENYLYFVLDKESEYPQYLVEAIDIEQCSNRFNKVLSYCSKHEYNRLINPKVELWDKYRDYYWPYYENKVNDEKIIMLHLWLLCDMISGRKDFEYFAGQIEDYIAIVNIDKFYIKFYENRFKQVILNM